ncbi:flagellar basal body L-ring protein FlgH [Aurantivibrio plasticivorans]
MSMLCRSLSLIDWKNTSRWITRGMILLAMSVLQACVIAPPPEPDDPYYAPVVHASAGIPKSSEGSLFQDGLAIQLYNDQKAHRVGDIITVMLDERTVSSKSSTTSVTKDNSAQFNEDADQGILLGTNPTFKNLSMLTNIEQSREFEGEAESDQSNRLMGNITVTVADILPNGNLVVRGEKWMTLNQGEEFIRVSGIIRPQDVSAANTVLSTKLANARIAYSGTGTLANSQTMGWLGKVFNSVFWPF